MTTSATHESAPAFLALHEREELPSRLPLQPSNDAAFEIQADSTGHPLCAPRFGVSLEFSSIERIAALIPAFNEEPVLEGTITALVAAGCPLSDIYVVDDRSTDRTAEIARSLGVNIYTVPVNGGKARAQVAALAHFQLIDRYQWIVFLDGDTKVDVNFIKEMRSAVESDGVDTALYVGQVKAVKSTNLYSALRAMEYTFGHDFIKMGQNNCGVILVSPGCASMYKTGVLKNLHIDPMTLAEDMDLTIQIHRAGLKARYVNAAHVHTQDPGSLKDYTKQLLRWYRGLFQVIKKHQFLSLRNRKQTIDFYVAFLLLDAVFLNKFVAAILIVFFFPEALPLAALADVLIASGIACYAAGRTRRWDVVYKFPIYYWLTLVNYYLFMQALFEIIILRKELLAWNKVKRYEFDSPT